MTTVPQARIHGINDLRLDRTAAPECGPDDVLVRVRECGICGSDLGFLAMGGLAGPETPMAIGHELWGEVSEAGVHVSHVAPGDKVIVQPLANGSHIGNGGAEGGFTSQLLVRNAARYPGSVIPLPATVPEHYGALIEPLAVALHSVNRVAAGAADRAVVFGAGTIGLCIVQMLVQRGLRDIVAVDLSPQRLQSARTCGASTTLRGDDPQLAEQLMDAHGVSDFFGMPTPASTVYFEATGSRQVFEGIVELAGPGSRLCLTGVHKEAASIDLVGLLAKELSIIPALAYEDEFAQVLEVLQSGAIDPLCLVTHRFPLSDIAGAFAAARDTDGAIKVMVDCQA